MTGERINQNYKIIRSVMIGECEFVMGENLKSPNSYVTWECKDGDNYFWGHYMSDRLCAEKDLYERAIVKIEFLMERQKDAEISLEIQPLKTEEILYTGKQSMQLDGQTGCVGYLKGGFGESGEYQSKWTDRWDDRRTDEFNENLNKVIKALSSKNYGLFESRETMREFEKNMPVSTFEREGKKAFGFRVDMGDYAFLIRCDSVKGEFGCFCYQSKDLDRHIEKAGQGIRFIDPHYKELFKITDGERIEVTTAWGEKFPHTCRFIDEYHTELDGNVYHICEFAERMHMNGATYAPMKEEPQKQKAKER